MAIIRRRNPTWDLHKLNLASICLNDSSLHSPKDLTSQHSEGLTETTSVELKPSAVIHDFSQLLPNKDNTEKRPPHFDNLKPAFAFLRCNSISLNNLRSTTEVFNSLGERIDDFAIAWIGKNYKRYRWLLGFSNGDQYRMLIDCFQVVLLSYYSKHCDYRRFRRHLHETLFDKFIMKELCNRQIYTKALRSQFDIPPSRFHLQNVCSYHSKFLVRLVLIANNDVTKIRFVCHVLYTIELLIKEMLIHSNGVKEKKKTTKTDSAYQTLFNRRWKHLMKFGKKIPVPIMSYFEILFKFCLQILSPILEHCTESHYEGCNILLSKRYVQSELLMLNDKRFIAQFQMLNWERFQDQLKSVK